MLFAITQRQSSSENKNYEMIFALDLPDKPTSHKYAKNQKINTDNNKKRKKGGKQRNKKGWTSAPGLVSSIDRIVLTWCFLHFN